MRGVCIFWIMMLVLCVVVTKIFSTVDIVSIKRYVTNDSSKSYYTSGKFNNISEIDTFVGTTKMVSRV